MSSEDTTGAALALIQSLQDPKKLANKLAEIDAREKKLAADLAEFAEERQAAARIFKEHRKYEAAVAAFKEAQEAHANSVEQLKAKQKLADEGLAKIKGMKQEREGLDNKAAALKRREAKLDEREAELNERASTARVFRERIRNDIDQAFKQFLGD